MRLVSQDGIYDIPYEKCLVYIYGDKKTIKVQPLGEVDSEYVFATYSTEVKAIKVMEMLREKYAKLEIFNSVYQKGLLTELNKELGFDEMQNILTSIFRFPKDEEVEV